MYSSSSPEATSSSSSNPKGHTEQPTVLQQPHAGVTSTSHRITTTDTLNNSHSSPGCYNRDTKCSVKSSVRSDVSKSPSRKCSRPKSVVQTNGNLQCHKERLSSHQHSGKDQLGRNIPKNDPGNIFSRSNVRSKVSWV